MRLSSLRLITPLAAAMFTCTTALAAPSQESIQSFDSQIMVNQDASIDVNETIKIQANQQQFQHGLLRELTDAHPRNYEIRSITVDGVPVSYHVQVKDGDLSVFIGDSSKLLPPGLYTYTLSYHVHNAVKFGTNADMLQWNIINDQWTMPIQLASTTIQLPDQAALLTTKALINNQPATNQVRVLQATGGIFNAVTTKPLAAHQSFSVALSWPKGIVQVKLYSHTLEADVTASRVNEWELGILLAVLAYYLFFWFRVGRNLNDGNVMPLFQPPANLSAAAMRYLTKMRFDEKTFNTGLVSLATKRYLTISGDEEHLTLTQNRDASAKLAHEEELLLNALFAEGETLTITSDQRQRLRHAKHALRHALKAAYEQLYFKSNRGYIRVGILLSLAAFMAPIASAVQQFHAFMAVVSLCFFTYVLYRIGEGVVRNFTLAHHITNARHIGMAIGFCVMFALTAVGAAWVLSLYTNNIPLVTLIILGLLFLVNLLFSQLMRTPTVAGREILNQIEGFRIFFSSTEKTRFAALAPPEMTRELLDKYCPYAIALGEQHAWGERMWQVTGHAPQATYCPDWLILPAKMTIPMRRFAFIIGAHIMHALHRARV